MTKVHASRGDKKETDLLFQLESTCESIYVSILIMIPFKGEGKLSIDGLECECLQGGTWYKEWRN